MSISVLSAFKSNCGRDLICLSSILSVLNTSAILKLLPSQFKRPEGDFMTLLNVMEDILLVKQSVPAQQFHLDRVCNSKGLGSVKHILNQAVRRYTNLEKALNLSDDFRQETQIKSGNWELIAKSLLTGYWDQVFVSMKEIQGKIHRFERFYYKQKPRVDVAVLDLQSTLTRSISSSPVSLVLARDVRYSTSLRATAVLSFVGEIESSWIEYQLERLVPISDQEVTKLNTEHILSKAKSTFSDIEIKITDDMTSNASRALKLKGRSGSVLKAELDIRQQLVTELKFKLQGNRRLDTTAAQNLERNLEGVIAMPWIFNPMIWRWQAQEQVKITVNNTGKVCEISCEGRDAQNQSVFSEFQAFLGWLEVCAVIRGPNSGE